MPRRKPRSIAATSREAKKKQAPEEEDFFVSDCPSDSSESGSDWETSRKRKQAPKLGQSQKQKRPATYTGISDRSRRRHALKRKTLPQGHLSVSAMFSPEPKKLQSTKPNEASISCSAIEPPLAIQQDMKHFFSSVRVLRLWSQTRAYPRQLPNRPHAWKTRALFLIFAIAKTRFPLWLVPTPRSRNQTRTAMSR